MINPDKVTSHLSSELQVTAHLGLAGRCPISAELSLQQPNVAQISAPDPILTNAATIREAFTKTGFPEKYFKNHEIMPEYLVIGLNSQKMGKTHFE